jgi:hypothetical protein
LVVLKFGAVPNLEQVRGDREITIACRLSQLDDDEDRASDDRDRRYDRRDCRVGLPVNHHCRTPQNGISILNPD